MGVVGKFVEFFGPGVAQLSIADRATIANMCPEYGATAAFFPVDNVSIQYLEQTGEGQAAFDLATDGNIKQFGLPLLSALCLSHHNWQSFVSLFLDSGREAEKLDYITKYLKAVAMFRDYNDVSQDPEFTQVFSPVPV